MALRLSLEEGWLSNKPKVQPPKVRVIAQAEGEKTARQEWMRPPALARAVGRRRA